MPGSLIISIYESRFLVILLKIKFTLEVINDAIFLEMLYSAQLCFSSG